MNIGVATTRIKQVLGGYHQDVLKVLDDNLIFHYLDMAILEIKQELERPLREKDQTMVTGERGVTLPSDWMMFPSSDNAVRVIESGSDSEADGIPIPLVTDNAAEMI